MTHTTLIVRGMSCGHCEAAVEGELNSIRGVERSNANFERGTVEVRYDEGRVTTEDLEAAVEKAGYPATVEARS
jgi:copper chaperone